MIPGEAAAILKQAYGQEAKAKALKMTVERRGLGIWWHCLKAESVLATACSLLCKTFGYLTEIKP